MSAKLDLLQVIKQLSDTEKTILKLCDTEQRRNAFFLRVPLGLDIPSGLWNKVADVCKDRKLHLKKTGRFSTVADLEIVVSDLDWLWEGWIPKGFLTMLAGTPGTGKSTIAHHLLKVVVTGGLLPDGTKQKPTSAVIIETESAQILVNKHFHDMQIPADRVFMPGFDGDMMSQPDLGKREHQARVVQLCEEHHPALIVLDSIGGAHTRGENRIEDIRPLMQFFADLARDYDCAVLAVHHLRKRSEQFADADLRVEDVRGSGAITAFTRSLLGLSMKKKQRVLEVVKSNVAEISPPYLVEFTKNSVGSVSGVTFALYQEETRKTQVDLCVEWLQAELTSGAQAAQAVVENGRTAEGFSRASIFRAARTLEERGELIKTGKGRGCVWTICVI